MFGNRLTFNQELEQIRAESEERNAVRREMDEGELDDMPMEIAAATSPPPSLGSWTSTVKGKRAAKEVKRRAPIYTYWNLDEKAKKFRCGFGKCKQTYAETNSSSMLTAHTKSSHRTEWKKAEGRTTNSASSKSAAVPEAFQPVDPKLSRKEQQAIDDRLKRLITGGNLPFALVDYPEVREFAQALNPLYEVPSRFTLKAWLCADFEKYRQKVKAELANVPGRISLTLDPWISVAHEGYLGLMAHWVTSEFELQKLLLGFVSLPAEHTGEALKEKVMSILRDYGIAHKTFAWTMDGAANMKAFFNDMKPELQLERQSQNVTTEVSEFRRRCVCQVMNNVAEVGIEDDLKLVSWVREMVKFIRKPKAKKQYIALRESEKDRDKDRHPRLPLDVSTRWSSTLPMLRGAFEARHHLEKFRGYVRYHHVQEEPTERF
ncbi:hypothetical protein RvY_18932 [Ramazzottius varieornatus]|uniref:BED-type domain-containing protein n=1 Tax=Ramazzottius varieornatus TaxID=947166 RepID=A0A1D1W8X5_RAMVA|nr:hypothetical protein RvY_18932 [Ramazzottius varieornatus]